MIIEVSEIEWKKYLNEKVLSVAFNPEYLKPISLSFNCKVNYLISKNKEELEFAMVVFSKGNKVILPENFTYNPLWQNPKLSERKQIEIQISLIKRLKKKYNKVIIKLNINIYDVRSFKWEGFNVDVRYTYIRFKDVKPNKSIDNRLKNINDNNVNISIQNPSLEDIDMNIEFLKSLNFNKIKCESYRDLMIRWNENGFLRSFRIEIEGKIVGVFIILLDPEIKKAYTLMINGTDREYEYAHALVYQSIINWLDKNDFDEVDFCGANIQGIAYFKSLFNPELKPYFILNYSRFQKSLNFAQTLLNKI
jgi:hypothetical protein